MARHFQSNVYNNKVCDAFMVTRDDGTVIKFVPSKEGLYYYDFKISLLRHQENSIAKNVMVVATVDELRRN